MGALPQENKPADSWVDFFIISLIPKLKWPCKQSLVEMELELFERLYKKLIQIFNEEKPSFFMGDLWSGNFICNADSKPVLIDPAVYYYGHRSIDLAMTNFIRRFDKEFYTSAPSFFRFLPITRSNGIY